MHYTFPVPNIVVSVLQIAILRHPGGEMYLFNLNYEMAKILRAIASTYEGIKLPSKIVFDIT